MSEKTSNQMTPEEIARISMGTKQQNESLNQTFNRIMGRMMGRQVRYNYFQYKHVLYCWNVEPLSPGPETKNRQWACWRYRHNKKNRSYRMFGKKLYFTTRRKAKSRALNWYNKAIRESEKYVADKAKANAPKPVENLSP